MSSAANYPVTLFGLFQFPPLVAPDHDLHEALEEVHEALFGALVVIAVVHALAAMYHHVWMKDDTLRRMLPFARPRSP
jgi:cytochrome b561